MTCTKIDKGVRLCNSNHRETGFEIVLVRGLPGIQLVTAVVQWTTTFFFEYFLHFVFVMLWLKSGPFPDYQISLRSLKFLSYVVLLTTTNVGVISTHEKKRPITACHVEE